MTELLVVFARAPELGRVKTRLCPPLSSEHALALHRALVEDSLEHLDGLLRPGIQKILLLSRPLDEGGDLSIPEGWGSGVQSGGDLGERLANFFQSSFDLGATRVVVVGSDSPTLPIDVVREAFDHLENGRVVLGPAEDGGYYLLGCSEWIPELFENIDWGTDRVLDQTAAALAASGIAADTLIPWYDVDRAEDLEKLRQEISYLKRVDPALVPTRVSALLPAEGGTSQYAVDTDF